jgi:signal transduction histidine kinase
MLGLLQIQASTDPAYDAETFSSLNANLKRLSGYAEQIKSLYKRNTGEKSSTLSPIDISYELLAIANEVSQDADAINKKIVFEMDLSPDCYVDVPSPIVGRITENLLLNSFHASSDKSVVKIRSFSTNEHIHFVIEDNGAGIADEIKSKVIKTTSAAWDTQEPQNDHSAALK